MREQGGLGHTRTQIFSGYTHIFFFQNACFNGYGRVVVLLHVHPWWDDDDDMNSPQWLNDHKLECSDFQTKEC
jgi:hypothetical protein